MFLKCELIKPTIGYNRYLVPPPIKNETILSVEMSYTIRSIIYIDENENFIRTSFKLRKEWFDSKLIYKNLKTNSKNLVDPKDHNAIWIPWILELKSESEDKCKRGADNEIFEVLSNTNNVYEYNSISQYENAFLFKVF